MDVLQNVKLLQELISCGGEIYTWSYDADGQLLTSNCPNETLLATAFSSFGCKEKMLQHAAEHDNPVILGTALGLIWGAAFEKIEGKLHRCYLIGPVFFSDVSMRGIENGFKQYNNLEMSLAWKHQLFQTIAQIQVTPNMVFSRYMLMLHYCIAGEKLDASDLYLQTHVLPYAKSSKRDRHKVWMAEQAMLQMVRTGDLNYKAALSNSMLISNGVPVQGSDVLRQAKDSLIVFASIVCRAAIEGGLSPEEAYSLGDNYIQSVESAANSSELSAIAPVMYDDFVRRVHKCRTNPSLSKQIQICCDYIEMHLEEKVRAKDLAALVGYTEYYVTRKFREETGYFVNDYIKFAKIERGKLLLISSDMTVQDIADKLGFSSRSYFSQVFRDIVGTSPIEYREAQRV